MPNKRVRTSVLPTVPIHFASGDLVRQWDYINLKDLRLVAAVTVTHCERLQKLFQRCCDITQAHDRSGLRSFGVPRPDEALADLAELRAAVEELRGLQKAIPKI